MSKLESKAKQLFQEIDTILEGNKHYTVEEIKDNEINFVSAIESKDTEYLQEYYPMLEQEQIAKIESMLSL
jgi:hypothetical protein